MPARWPTSGARGSLAARILVVAAHAAQTGRTIVSLDATARFAELPGVAAQVPSGLR